MSDALILGLITILISAIALFVAILSWWEVRKTRLRGEPDIKVSIDYEGFNSKQLDVNCRGTFIYFYRLIITNLGGKSTTFRGFFNEHPWPTIIPAQKFQLKEISLPFFIYVEDKLNFNDIIEKNYINNISAKSWEELRNLNISINSGDTKTISLAIKIQNSETDADMFFINLELLFNNGYRHSISKFIKINNKV